MRYHFTSQAQLALSNAKKIAKQCQNNYIGTEHLLLGICSIEEAQLSKLLLEYNVTYHDLMKEVVTLFGFSKDKSDKMEYTCTMDEILQQCLIIAYQNEMKLVDLNTLSICLLQADNNVADELLRRCGVDVETLMENMKTDELSVLQKFKELKNLNEMQRKSPTKIVQRDKEIAIMIDTLCRKQKANPLLIGEAGVGKSALVEELARRIVENEVPKELNDCIIYELSLNNLVAGTKYRGEFEEKIQKLLDTVLRFPQVILFIDEIHMMVNAGKAEGSIDVAGVLKPYLARGNLRCIGATTIDEYNTGIEKDRALKRRFQTIKIDEPSLNDVKEMVLCKKLEYERHHHVEFPNELIEPCLLMSQSYLPHLTFPDKAIDVLDLSCVKAKMLKLKKVDDTILRRTIESLSTIPFSYTQQFVKHADEFKGLCDERQIESMIQRFEYLDELRSSEGCKDIWMLQGNDEHGKRKLAETLAKAFLNHEKELVILDGRVTGQDCFEILQKKLKKNPFQIIYIENASACATQTGYVLDQIMKQGQLRYHDEVLDLKFSLIIADSMQTERRRMGFVQDALAEKNPVFSLHLGLGKIAG